jgi:toxin ParE1/3/4
MTGYRLSPSAQADLAEIWDYSARHWGDDRADRYILAIQDAWEALGDGRRQGRAIDAIRPGYRKLPVASHVLFFRVSTGGMIEVVRILHQRMDLTLHLDP